MNFPENFDPLTVTELRLNACYFSNEIDMEEAFRRAGEIFPNAKFIYMNFAEHPEWCVVALEPRMDYEMTAESYKQLTEALMDSFPQGPCRGMEQDIPADVADEEEDPDGEKYWPRESEASGQAWTPPDPEAWKDSEPRL